MSDPYVQFVELPALTAAAAISLSLFVLFEEEQYVSMFSDHWWLTDAGRIRLFKELKGNKREISVHGVCSLMNQIILYGLYTVL